MNRRGFFGFLGLGAATAVASALPKLPVPEKCRRCGGAGFVGREQSHEYLQRAAKLGWEVPDLSVVRDDWCPGCTPREKWWFDPFSVECKECGFVQSLVRMQDGSKDVVLTEYHAGAFSWDTAEVKKRYKPCSRKIFDNSSIILRDEEADAMRFARR